MQPDRGGADHTLMMAGCAAAMKLIGSDTAARLVEQWRREPKRSIEDLLRAEGVSDPDQIRHLKAIAGERLQSCRGDVIETLNTMGMGDLLLSDLPEARTVVEMPILSEGGKTSTPRPTDPSNDSYEAQGTVVGFGTGEAPPEPMDRGATIAPSPWAYGSRQNAAGSIGEGGLASNVPSGHASDFEVQAPLTEPGKAKEFASGHVSDFEAHAPSTPGRPGEPTGQSGQTMNLFAPDLWSGNSGAPPEAAESPGAKTFADHGPVLDSGAHTDAGATSVPNYTPDGLSGGKWPSFASGSGYDAKAMGLPLSATSSNRFRVLRQHARGGLGAVMVAFDEELRREVAVKEIRDQHADDPGSRSRFLLEAEVTGGLEHPGVVPVYSLGRNIDGRPFYAMRFIRGESLRKAIEGYKAEKLSLKPVEREFRIRQFLKRFIDVCNALEYAHSRQVIHRDIKPDNIMLGPYGETLVVDWGLAKAVNEQEFSATQSEEGPLRPMTSLDSEPTLAGSVIGTPAFMAPEQAVGDLERLGHRADVYSLGATLYNILTGQPPFTSKNLYENLTAVREGRFPRPRELDRSISPALEAVVLKAMEVRQEDRYPSCRALAEDVERWLADEPVSVYRDPLSVRFSRWARRHRTAVTLFAVMLPTIIVGLSIFSGVIASEQQKTKQEWLRAEQNATIARKNEAEALKQKRLAEDNERTARVNEQLAIANERKAKENEQRAIAGEREAQEQKTIAVANADRAERNFGTAIDAIDSLLARVGAIELRDVPQMEDTRRALLEKALAFYLEFLQQNDRNDLKEEVGRAQSRVGEIQDLLGALQESDARYADAAAIQRELVAGDPANPRYRADLADTLHRWAIVLKKLNRFEDSEAKLQEAIELRDALKTEDPKENGTRERDAAASRYQLGAVLARLRGRTEEANGLYDQAIATQRELVQQQADDPENLRLLARYLNNKAHLVKSADDVETRALYDEAIALQRRLLEMESALPSHRAELAWYLNSRGVLLLKRDFSEAENLIKEAVELAESLTQDYPKVPDYWKDLAGYLSNLGQAYKEQGKAAEAEEPIREAQRALERSIAIRRDLVRDYPERPEYEQRLAVARNSLAALHRGLGELEEAGTLIGDSVRTLEALVERYPEVTEYRVDLTNALFERGYVVGGLGNLDQAVEMFQRAENEAQQAIKERPENPEYVEAAARVEMGFANLELSRKRPEEAVRHADLFAQLKADDAGEQFLASVLYLRALAQVPGLESLSPEERASSEARYREGLLKTLGRAADLGYQDVATAEDVYSTWTHLPGMKELLDRIKENAKQAN